MIVRDFVALLAAYPDQEATVEVLEHTSGRGYYDQGGNVNPEEFDPAKHLHYTDLRGNPHITPDMSYFNAHYLLLGSRE